MAKQVAVEEPAVAPVTLYDPKDPKAYAESSAKFAQHFLPDLKPRGQALDDRTQGNLNEYERNRRAYPHPPATIINLHPWPLRFPASTPLIRGVEVEACHAGMELQHRHVRHSSRESFYNEDGSRGFKPVPPIRIAAEFVREFSNNDNYGGGVVIYMGGDNPFKMLDKEVETYDPIGLPITTQQLATEFDEEDKPVQVYVDVPVKRLLKDLINEQRRTRNDRYMRRVQTADDYYKSNDPKLRRLILPTDRLMAEVLVAEAILPKMPDWNLSTTMEQGLSGNACPACGAMPQAAAYLCPNGHVLDPVAAYLNSFIEYGHVSMDRMTTDQWLAVEEEKVRRDKLKADLQAMREAGGKKK